VRAGPVRFIIASGSRIRPGVFMNRATLFSNCPVAETPVTARGRTAGSALLLALVAVPALAIAQQTGADAGVTLWGAFRSLLYGPWGLVGSAIVVGMGIYMFLERGFMHALGVMAAGALIFFVPLIVVSMRNAAQALGGAG
jgi:hypothetical protein